MKNKKNRADDNFVADKTIEKGTTIDRQKLIKSIEEDAKQEAERIIKEAKVYVTERRKAAEGQVERIKGEAGKKAEQQIQKIEKNNESAIAVETHRITLKAREQVISSVLREVEKRLQEMIDEPEYREILLGWIVEAAVGLNATEAEVNVSVKEQKYLTESLLKEAESIVHELFLKNVRLFISKEDLLLSQGVVLTAKEGRTAFNNQLKNRLLRYGTEIRKLIQRELFE